MGKRVIKLLLAIMILAAIALIPSLASAERSTTLLHAEEMDANVKISGSINIYSEASPSSVDKAKIRLYLQPLTDKYQRLVSLNTIPEAAIGDDVVEFVWENPGLGELKFSLDSEISNLVHAPQVTKETKYPLAYLPAEFVEYTQPTPDIDITPAIRSLARNLSQGKDELFELEFTLASWVKDNVKYDLSSLGADSVQRSSWVLENRRGVCDELTSLFISLNRALGIPTRFVSGMAYTNLESFEKPWVGHAWAEVYFPGAGWIPYDIAYGELGYLDATHIALARSDDSSDSSVKYEILGRNVNFKTGELKTEVEILDEGSQRNPTVKITAKAYADKVRFGSSNIIYITLQNILPSYQVVDLGMSNTTHLAMQKRPSMVLLKPREKREIPIIVTLDRNLDEGYKYTFPVTAYSGNHNSTVSFEAYEQGVYYGRQQLEEIIQESATLAAADISIQCTSPEPGERQTSCKISTKIAGKITACLEDDCRALDFQDSDTEPMNVNFSLPRMDAGVHILKATARRGFDFARDVVVVTIPETASLRLENVSIPSIISYGQQETISFIVKANSSTLPVAANVTIEHDNFKQLWAVEDMASPQKFSLVFQGKSLDSGDNTVRIYVEFEDEEGRKYNFHQDEKIILENVTATQQFALTLRDIELWLKRQSGLE